MSGFVPTNPISMQITKALCECSQRADFVFTLFFFQQFINTYQFDTEYK